MKTLTIFKINKDFYDYIENIDGNQINLGIKQFIIKEEKGERVFHPMENWAKNIYNFCSSYNKKINKNENIEKLDYDNLIIELKKKNQNYFDKNVEANLKMQMNFIHEMYKEKQITEIKHIKLWIKRDFPSWKKEILGNEEKSKLKYIAKTVAVISIANKMFLENNKKEGYYLRDIQIIAILLFISKSKDEGLIEEIGTGEGKTTIIFTLAIFLGLIGHTVDIITSASNLAKRDAELFRELYKYFDLSVDYSRDRDPKPYEAHILYGTFYDFEGDFLREVTGEKQIRNKRPFDAIIIDEVDNIFIDNIGGSTMLVNGSKGYSLLSIIYIEIYMFINYFFEYIIDYFRQLDEKKNYNKEFLQIIEDPFFKNEILKVIKPILKDIILQLITTKKEKEKKNENNNQNNLENFLNNLKIIIPTHLKEFIECQLDKWINNAFKAKNQFFLEKIML